MRFKITFFFILFFGGTFSAAQANVLKVCYDQWPPMTIYPTPKDPRRGFIIEMLSDIYKEAGYDLDFYPVPLARGLDMVAKGECDLLPESAFSHNETDGYVFADEETFEYPMAFVVRNDDDLKYDGISSIQDRRVATGPGWDYSSMSLAYQSYLDDPLNKANVETMAGENDVVNRILNMIATKRIDLYADNVFVLKYLINETGLSDQLKIVLAGPKYKLIEKPIFSTKIPLPKRQKLITIWNDGRRKIAPEKEKKYLGKYGVVFTKDDK